MRRHDCHQIGLPRRHVHFRQTLAQYEQCGCHAERGRDRQRQQQQTRRNVGEHHCVHQTDASGQPGGNKVRQHRHHSCGDKQKRKFGFVDPKARVQVVRDQC